MRIGLFSQAPTVDGFIEEAGRAREAGLASFWTPQIFSHDALTVLAMVGREVPDIELGTSVIPTYPRHPIMLASQALTTQEASGGRLTLGIGLSHQMVIENMFGYSFERPAQHMEEYLSSLMPLLRDRAVGFQGDMIKATGQLQLGEITPPAVVVAALGPRMLKLTGELADGTITWMTGPKTIGAHITPSIKAAAADADRGEPRVVVAMPMAVSDDEAELRERAGNVFAMYGHLPSYRAMLDREGAEGPADVVVAGSATQVRGQIEAFFEAGATEFAGFPFHDPDGCLEVLADLT